MKKKLKYFLITISIIITIPFLCYVLPYIWMTRTSIYLMNEAIIADNGDTVWAFGSLRQRLDLFLDPKTPEYEGELKMRKKYLPLIKIDRYLFGNYHILEDDLPNIGG